MAFTLITKLVGSLHPDGLSILARIHKLPGEEERPPGHKEVSVDQFIVLCVQVQRFTEAFRQRDTQQNGTITIGFEDFLTVAIGCSY